jgi:hypothetical protein
LQPQDIAAVAMLIRGFSVRPVASVGPAELRHPAADLLRRNDRDERAGAP